MKNCYFAVDLGATSGRTLLASFSKDGFEMEEVNRFPNHIIQTQRHLYWDIYELYRNIIEGLRLASKRRDIRICSIGIDTWGVDFVLVGKDGEFLRQPYSYRDPHTQGAPEKYFKHQSKSMVYKKTGIQIMDFNSLFQFDTLRRNKDDALSIANKILFIPDALSYMLTSEMVCEYTIASTAQIVNAHTRQLDDEILASIGLTSQNFGRFVKPGQLIGKLSKEVQQITGLNEIPVIAVAGHDTGSAVAAVPALDDDFAYLSSGTWSLMGIEVQVPVINDNSEAMNFTNEGGVNDTIRLLKNICGMWLLEQCRLKWGTIPYTQLIEEAESSQPFRSLINPDDPTFVKPCNMIEAIQQYCRLHNEEVPSTRGEIVRCILESLALRYHQVLECLKVLSPVDIRTLHIIGGGSQNKLLNQFTANATSVTVVAGPTEATGIGNVMLQALALGHTESIAQMRQIIHKSIPLKIFPPRDKELWMHAYQHFLKITK